MLDTWHGVYKTIESSLCAPNLRKSSEGLRGRGVTSVQEENSELEYGNIFFGGCTLCHHIGYGSRRQEARLTSRNVANNKPALLKVVLYTTSSREH